MQRGAAFLASFLGGAVDEVERRGGEALGHPLAVPGILDEEVERIVGEGGRAGDAVGHVLRASVAHDSASLRCSFPRATQEYRVLTGTSMISAASTALYPSHTVR